MPEKRKKYDREFREGAVRIVEETGKPIAQVARDLGINEGTLGNWVARAREAREGTRRAVPGDVEELKRLRAENAELRMERDVLKRSVVLWVKEATSERGPVHRRPEDQLPGAAHDDLCRCWAWRVLVLQVAHPATPTPRERRRAEVDAAVATAFADARGLHGSPRLHADLREAGWTVSEKTVADSMRRQGLVARKIGAAMASPGRTRRRRSSLTCCSRDFTADAPNLQVGRRHDRDPHRRRASCIWPR